MAKPNELSWTPMQMPDCHLDDDSARHQPEPEQQPLWHTVVACATGFPLGYAVAFCNTCLSLYELPWQSVAITAILPGLLAGLLIAARIEDELRFR